MSIISDAILESLMTEGVPIFIIPETRIRKKKSLEEGFKESVSQGFPSGTQVIPSPS